MASAAVPTQVRGESLWLRYNIGHNSIRRAYVKMHHRHPSKAPSKLKAFQTRQLTVCSACTCLPLKCFQYARSLTSLLKSDCAAIDSPRSDKQLRAWTCQPVNHGSLTFPSALRISPSPSSFFLHASKAKPAQKFKAAYNPSAPESTISCPTRRKKSK